jgi:hypothetical protein
MNARSLKAVAAAAVVVATTALMPAPADAASAYYFYGYAGGSIIRDANSAITSQLSAESEVLTARTGVQDTNALAAVNAQGVLSLGTVKTSAKTSAIPGGRQVSVTAQSADVNVLNGLITADTISTTTTTKRVNGIFTTTTQSAFRNLHIPNVKLPPTIPQNFTVKVSDLATVVVNAGLTFDSHGTGVGLRVTLLKTVGTADTGAEIDVNPTFTTIASNQSPTTGHSTMGSAYATKITSAGGSAVTVPSNVFAEGTGGQTLTNSVAAVNLTPVGTVGAAQTTGVGTNTTTVASVTMTASVANLNLLNGLITAQSLKVTAHADLSQTTGAMTLVDLQIGGTTIPLNVKPNTVINLDIGKVTINQRIRSGQSISIRAIDIVLAKATNGLPVGAEIQVAPATAAVS